MAKIKLNKIQKFFKKLPIILAEHTFLTLLGSTIIVLLFGGIIFYQYGILAQKTSISIEKEKTALKFDEEIYQRILSEWHSRSERFSEADFRKHPNPFNTSTKELTK